MLVNARVALIFINNEELANINPKVMILATNGKTDKNRTKFIDPAVWKSKL